MTNVDEHVLHEIDDALQVDIDKEEIIRKVFILFVHHCLLKYFNFLILDRCFGKRGPKPKKSSKDI